MGAVHNIRDWKILKFHAQSLGYTSQEYIAQGRRESLTIDQLLNSAKTGETIEDMIAHNKRIKRLKRVGLSVAAAVVSYTLNFGVMYSVANSSLSPEAREDLEKIAGLNSKAQVLQQADGITGSFNPLRTIYAYDGRGLFLGIQAEFNQYGNQMSKAVNPLNHLF
jgi:hypothetical protein